MDNLDIIEIGILIDLVRRELKYLSRTKVDVHTKQVMPQNEDDKQLEFDLRQLLHKLEVARKEDNR